jgi:hypothetical protein
MSKIPNNDGADIFRDAGYVSIQQKNWAAALQNLIEAHQRRPHGPYIRLLLAQVLIEVRRIDEAIPHLEAIASQEFPDHQAALKRKLESKIGFQAVRQQKSKVDKIKKSEIINQLVLQFNLNSYLEYNKVTGELCIDDVACQNKFITYISEPDYKSTSINECGDYLTDAHQNLQFTPLNTLFTQHSTSKFDIIYFDPTQVGPDVNIALQKLSALLNPGGFLIIHGCNPESKNLTSKKQISDTWLGETFKGFSLFRLYNPLASFTINEDCGIGVVFNHNLDLDYPINFEFSYEEFDAQRVEFLNLITYRTFRERLREHNPLLLMRGAIQNQRIVVVLGMHRSGTSALTHGLSCLGIDLGDNLLEPAKNNNPKGFFEDADINSLNVEILECLGLNWDSTTPITIEDLTKPEINQFLTKAILLIQEKLSGKLIFGLKEPRIARLFPFWQRVFAYFKLPIDYVFACRNPLSIADSLNKRDNIPLEKSYDLWLQYVIPCFIQAQQLIKVVVDYDLLMENPRRELMRIGRQLNIPINDNDPNLQKYYVNFLDQQLRHTQYMPTDVMVNTQLPETVKQAYWLLYNLAQDEISIQANEIRDQFIQFYKEIN